MGLPRSNLEEDVRALLSSGFTSKMIEREIAQRNLPDSELREMGVVLKPVLPESNILAAYGTGQLKAIKDRMEAREADAQYAQSMERLADEERER